MPPNGDGVRFVKLKGSFTLLYKKFLFRKKSSRFWKSIPPSKAKTADDRKMMTEEKFIVQKLFESKKFIRYLKAVLINIST